jgi:hypothetical protein
MGGPYLAFGRFPEKVSLGGISDRGQGQMFGRFAGSDRPSDWV